jgi:ribosomal protein S27AE
VATIRNIVNELDNLFAIFNNRYFENQLVRPVIVVQTSGRRLDTLGWCTTRKMWRNTASKEEYYEITICAEHMFRPVEEICETLLHEMAHLFNLQNGIKDVSRGSSYHNSKYKKTAQMCGLAVDYHPLYGWTITSLTNKTREFIEKLKLNAEDFALTRKGVENLFVPPGIDGGAITTGVPDGSEDIGKKKRQSYRKYACPACGMVVRATKDVNVKCGDCGLTMQKQDS